MLPLPPPAVVVLDALALAAVSWVLARCWHRRDDRHVRPFLVAVTLLCAATLAQPLSVVTAGLDWTAGIEPFRFRGAVQVTVLSLSVVPWFVFALRHTGRDDVLTRPRVAAAALPGLTLPASLWLLALGTPAVGWYDAVNVVAVLSLYLVLSALAVGAFLLVAAAAARERFPRGQALVLSVGATVPLLTGVAATTVPTGGLLVPVGLCVGSLACAAALSRYRLFDAVPATSYVGRDRIVDDLPAAVFVTDRDGVVRDANRVARQTFEDDAVTGVALSTVLGTDAAPAEGTATVELSTPAGQRRFRVSADTVTSRTGRRLGRIVVLADVTDSRTREQQLTVLNRALRHNLRNGLDAMAGFAEHLDEPERDPATLAARIEATATDLAALGETADELATVMNAPPTERERIAVPRLFRAVRDDVAGPDRRERIAVDAPDELWLRANPAIVRPVVEELVDNALEHGAKAPGSENDASGPTVTLSATVTDDAGERIEIRVADRGPGIPERELAAVREGTETQLRHGSGLGLWLVTLGVHRLGGTVSFDERAPRGTVVTLSLPSLAGESPTGEPTVDESSIGESAADRRSGVVES